MWSGTISIGFGSDDLFEKRHCLLVIIDGVHFSEATGKVYAKLLGYFRFVRAEASVCLPEEIN